MSPNASSGTGNSAHANLSQQSQAASSRAVEDQPRQRPHSIEQSALYSIPSPSKTQLNATGAPIPEEAATAAAWVSITSPAASTTPIATSRTPITRPAEATSTTRAAAITSSVSKGTSGASPAAAALISPESKRNNQVDGEAQTPGSPTALRLQTASPSGLRTSLRPTKGSPAAAEIHAIAEEERKRRAEQKRKQFMQQGGIAI
jgi:hypothetical protein